MNRRVGSGFSTVVSAAFDMLPAWLAVELRGTHFLCGVDPLFVGLHGFAETEDRRSYRDTAHVVYPYHLTERPVADRQTTVVMPTLDTPRVVIHELGHVLDELLGWPDVPEPVTAYAETNRWEAFAEAFTMAHVPGYAPWDISLRRLAEYRRRVPDLAPFFTGLGA